MQNVPPPVFLKMITIKLCFILTKIWIYEILFTFCVIFVLIYFPHRECADLHVILTLLCHVLSLDLIGCVKRALNEKQAYKRLSRLHLPTAEMRKTGRPDEICCD